MIDTLKSKSLCKRTHEEGGVVGVLVDVDVDLLVGPVRGGGLQPVLRQPVAAPQPADAADAAAEAGRVVRGARQAGRGAQRRGEERGAAARRAAPPAIGRGGGRGHRRGLPGAVEVGPHARLRKGLGVIFIPCYMNSQTLASIFHLLLQIDHLHRLSSACGRSFVCFGFGLCTLPGSKNKTPENSTTSG